MRIESLDIKKIIKKTKEDRNFHGVVSVSQDNQLIFGKGYGYANRNQKNNNTLNTRFGIASGCKIFTAVAICQLVQKGLISFDTMLNDCLDISFPNFDSDITINHLLTHTSGILDYFDESVMDNYEALWDDIPMYKMKNCNDFLPLFQNNKMKFSPGEKFDYNNAGYILLGLIIEQQTGMKFQDYIQKNIFDVCNMDDSGYFSLDKLPERCAHGYIENEENNIWRTNVYSIPIIGGPDGGAFVTALDITKFWKALFDNRLLDKNTTEKLLTPQAESGDDCYYGFGVWVTKKEGKIYKYCIMGRDPGVSFRSSIYIDNNIQVNVLGNTNWGGYAITNRIEEELIKTIYY
ncbi:serine hydrolase domain-containing protein [Tepidibacter aestuarii]|uniref:serine hydrolase domain-containing protein n=1 Tax=Tepidibacter aestuarii TaxID=2925782 RepID=UPI0020BEEAF2|nr:serine hydrolase [Tepidibacter aestuarii]CAH2212487.1 Penicillin-binding protein [Tepidibacter aestuarii]